MFIRGCSPKRVLGIGMSFDNLQRGSILKVKKDFSVTRFGDINNHMKAWNKFEEGDYVVIEKDPKYSEEGRVSFYFRVYWDLESASKFSQSVIADPEMKAYYRRTKIFYMSRLQFSRRLEVIPNF